MHQHLKLYFWLLLILDQSFRHELRHVCAHFRRKWRMVIFCHSKARLCSRKLKVRRLASKKLNRSTSKRPNVRRWSRLKQRNNLRSHPITNKKINNHYKLKFRLTEILFQYHHEKTADSYLHAKSWARHCETRQDLQYQNQKASTHRQK